MTRAEKNAVEIAIGIIRNGRALNADTVTVDDFKAEQRRLWGRADNSPKTRDLGSDALNDEAIGWGLSVATRQAFRSARGCGPVSVAVCAITDLEVAA